MIVGHTDPKKLKSEVLRTTPGEERPRPIGILKEGSVNDWNIEKTLSASFAYNTASIYFDTSDNGRVQAN